MSIRKLFPVMIGLIVAGFVAVHSQSPTNPEMTGRLIVKFRTHVSRSQANSICKQIGATPVFFRADIRAALVNNTTLQAIHRKRGWDTNLIEYIEPEIAMQAFAAPNDPYYSSQWNFQDSGYGIKLTSARALADGTGVTVAVVDTGIRRDTPDLQGAQFVPGFDIINNDGDATDDNGHGTHVAGTIAQTTDNGYGMAGIAPKVMLMPVKVLAANGSGSNYTVASGIRFAADHGARVINMSLGGGGSQTLLDAVRYATGKGVVICCAAGNGGTQSLSYPAAYAECISVAATDQNGSKASFSQYGEGLTISAPGVNILQQTFNPSTGQFVFAYWAGTSMATPHVTGIVALIRQVNNGLIPAQVKELLQRTAIDRGAAGYDTIYGAGIVNALAAVRAAGGTAPNPTPTPTPNPGPATEADKVFQLVNQERAKVGLAALARNSQLESAAQKHAIDMATYGYFSHFSRDGSSPGDRILREGYRWMTYGEDLAWGYSDPASTVQAWMNSSGHRANILNSRFRDIGVGIARNSNGRPYWVTDFASR